MRKSQIVLIILTLSCMAFIFYWSSQDAQTSTSVSEAVTYQAVHSPVNASMTFIIFHRVIRKMAHLSEYALLGGLLFATVRSFLGKGKRAVYHTLFIGVAYAVSDEIHQLFVVGRTARVFDVMVDSVGILIGMLVLYWFGKQYEKRKTKIAK